MNYGRISGFPRVLRFQKGFGFIMFDVKKPFGFGVYRQAAELILAK